MKEFKKKLIGEFRQSNERKEKTSFIIVDAQSVKNTDTAYEKACDTLIRLLDDAQSESIKHRVAVDMLNMTLKFMEFRDIEQRLKKLEETSTT